MKEKILIEDPNVKSRAALLKLIQSILNNPLNDNRPTYLIWLDFRKKFLEDKKKKYGSLVCVYCGQKDLEMDTEGHPPSKQATIDHVFPLSKGGEKYDEKNLVVSCRVCNEKKGDEIN